MSYAGRPWLTARVVSVLGGCLASGCMVGPDFSVPAAELPARWSAGGPASDKALASWWRVFRDPALNRLVDDVAAQNLTLQVAGLRVAEARAQLAIAYGKLFPQQQQATGSFSFNHNETQGYPNPDFRALGADFDSSWELDLWGQQRRGVRSARAGMMAGIAGYYDSSVSVIAETVNTYISVRSFDEQIVLARRNIEYQTRSTAIVKSRWDNGQSGELDYRQAQTELLNTQALVPQLETSRAQAVNALATLLGRPPGDMSGYLPAGKGLPEPPGSIATGVPADLLRRRPDIRQAALQAASQCEQIGIAKADLYPHLTLSGSLGWSASDIGPNRLSRVFNNSTSVFSAGPSVNWDVFNYGRLRNQVRASDAAFQQALLAYRSTVLSAAGEVENALSAFRNSRRQADFMGAAVETSLRARDLSLKRYQEGEVDYQTVISSIQAVTNAQNSHVSALASADSAVAGAYKALGGGWSAGMRAPVIPAGTLQEMEKRTAWGGLLDMFRKPAP